MRLFSLISMQFQKWEANVREYLSKTLSEYGTSYGSSTIFGQLINVLGSITQNVLSYIEDALTEQNKYTASRKKSIYSLASLSGYEPYLGSANTCNVKLSFMPDTDQYRSIVIPDKTLVTCLQNGLTYNILLQQESMVMRMGDDNSSRILTLVEGAFETQRFVSTGGVLYTVNVKFSGDCDLRYLEVYVNDELWERASSIYDMTADSKEYIVKNGYSRGIDIVFGNDMHGRSLDPGDDVKVVYLLHSGEDGNLDNTKECIFIFSDNLMDTEGNEVQANKLLNIEVQSSELASSGTNSESIEKVKEMIGYNSRSLVLADAKNYKQFFNRYSFVGYNRTWVEEGSLIVNSLIIRNFKLLMSTGEGYFNLRDQDFLLNDEQKKSIKNSIKASGQMLAGSIFNIFSPELCKYALYVYIKLKDKTYDKESVSSKIRNAIGNFFADIKSDMFIPKSDIIKLIKDTCEEVDGVNVYFISELNENAKRENKYIEKKYVYNPINGTFDVIENTVYLYNDENPNLGLDAHGNIYLESDFQFPILSGGWNYYDDSTTPETEYAVEPLTIIYE